MVRKCQRNIRNTIRIAVSICAISICSYQVYLVSKLYFNYPTTVDTRLDPTPNVRLPGITICSELSSTILVEELVKIRPELYSTFAGKTRTEISLLLKKKSMRNSLLKGLNSLPINEQHQLTVKSDMFFKHCQVPTPLGKLVEKTKDNKNNRSSSTFQLFPLSSSHVDYSNVYGPLIWSKLQNIYKSTNCSQMGPIIETISYDFKCFTLFHNQTFNDHSSKNLDYEIPKDIATNFKYLVWMELNRDFMYNGLIYVHSPELSHQYAGTSSVQQLDPDKHQFVSVAFERHTIQLLPAPYTTDCFDYKKIGYSCRQDCLTQCKIMKYFGLDGWPGDVFANKSISKKFSVVWANDWSKNGHIEEGIASEALAGCAIECGSWDDCESTFYDARITRVESRDEADYENSHSLTLGILPPKNVLLRSKHVPKFEFIEFLIYIGSLIGLYLGISFMSFGVSVLTCITFSAKYQTDCLLWRCCCGDDFSDMDDDANEPAVVVKSNQAFNRSKL